MAPIRVGLIGLSGTATNPQAPGAWALSAHLPSIQSSDAYQLVALANSSVEAAHKAIKAHKLPPETKAYGNPTDLANDPNVDLIVVSVNVGLHYALAKPALQAGKNVFVEWPLGASTKEAEELTELARAKGAKTIVGLQARADPMVRKVKELVESGRIGDVTSSTVVGSFSPLPTDVWMEGGEYYLDMESGGNGFYIFFGHFLDTFLQTLGPFSPQTPIQSILKTHYPTTNLLSSTGESINPTYPRTSPDHVLVQGTLSSGALASIAFRSLPAAVDGTGFRWLITGTKGEIEVLAPESQWQMGGPGRKIKVKVGKEGAAEEVDFTEKEESLAAKVGFPGANTAGIYEAFAMGDKGVLADFEDALELHKVLGAIRESAGV